MEENRKSTAIRNTKKPTVTPEDVELGKRLRAIREAKGYSMELVAKHIGISYQQVQKYETGKK